MWNREKFEKEYQLQFDEINKLVSAEYENADAYAMADLVESFLILAYKLGKKTTDEMLDFYDEMDDIDDMAEALAKQYGGIGYEERILEYMASGDLKAIQRVVSSEYHRMFSQGSADEANRVAHMESEGAVSRPSNSKGEEMDIPTQKASPRGITKTWNTMLDPRVRDAHNYIEGVTVGVNEKFYTYDDLGNLHGAMMPHGFNVPELDVNCRCYLSYGRE